MTWCSVVPPDPSPAAIPNESKGFGHIGHGDGPWQAPRPLDDWTPPHFPAECFPNPLAAFIVAEAEATQTPPDLAGMCVLGTLAAAAAKKYEITPMEGWVEPLNLWPCVVLPPGERKSAVHRAACRPIHDYEREHAAKWRREFNQKASERRLLEKRIKHAEEAASKSKGKDAEALSKEIEDLTAKLAETPPPIYPRLLADDCTPERIVSLLAEQGGRLGIFSAEGTLFSILAGRYSSGSPSIESALKAHAGDPITVDRMGRPGERVDSPALTLCLTVQPDVLSEARSTKEFYERGLFARFLFTLPRSRVGARAVSPPCVSKDTYLAYATRIRAVLDLPEDRDAAGEILSTPINLSGPARRLFDEFRSELEPRLRPDPPLGDLAGIGSWAGKLAGSLARIAGLFHVAEHARAAGGAIPSDVDQETILRVLPFAEYFIAHARAAHSILVSGSTREAKRVLEWLKEERLLHFTKRDAHRKMRGHLAKAEELDAPLDLLEERGYIRGQDSTGKAGRPSEVYGVNPCVHGQNGQYSDGNARRRTP